MPSLADLVSALSSGNGQQGGTSLGDVSQIFHSYANPDAVLNSPVAGFALGVGGAGADTLQALRTLQQQIIGGAMSGEAKYAALRDLARRMRALQGDVAPEAGPSMVPADVTLQREIMDRVNQLRTNPMKFKD